MTQAEMEAIIAELEAGFLAECECDDCWGHGADGYEGVACAWCNGTGLNLQKPEGKRAANGIWARRGKLTAFMLTRGAKKGKRGANK